MASDPGESPPTPSPRSRRRAVAAALAVLVPVVPIVVGLLLPGGSPAADATPTTTSTAAFTPVAQQSAKRPHAAVPPGSGALVGSVRRATPMRASPGGRQFAVLRTKTEFGSPTFVLVTRVQGPWLGVINTAAGNNRLGWIRSSAVSLSRDTWSLRAHLARHQLVVVHNGKAVRTFTIAIGSPAAPTPTGRYAVTDRLATGDPSGPYGCCILALSAKAPHHISDWAGGNRIAIHSTPETSSIGSSVSHGCMRLTLAEGRWLLAHIPLGTPTEISSA